ncbi:copper chaperone PCu(A)C [Comamonas resistens]|uniref:Copper chaperone PCu(A)C n=1 Tax=Comamonas resistens TaxID=3046670 RepID=A0ABY8SVK3_9BURK|nr:copper chaperone PCu(A)C [Comamonas resistens]MDL5038724.1 copper chaperone PCu(A)C [Comamonas resistens]WHS65914.1 copper chaperone PCu(A)C [Comamonas resistens]
MNMRRTAVMALGSLLISGMAWAHPDAAHVKVENAWARASVPGQQASGAFMRLTAEEPLKLVGVETSAAGVAEVHEMKMEGDVMRMRAIDSLDLPKGVAVDLKPGGYHLMLQQLKAPLVKDSQVSVTLIFKDAKGEQSRLNLQLPVRMAAPGAAAAKGHEAMGHGAHMH